MPKKNSPIQDVSITQQVRHLLIGAAITALVGGLYVLVSDHFTTLSHVTQIRALTDEKVETDVYLANQKTEEQINSRIEGKVDLLLKYWRVPVPSSLSAESN